MRNHVMNMEQLTKLATDLRILPVVYHLLADRILIHDRSIQKQAKMIN